jgi:hypothetical protein
MSATASGGLRASNALALAASPTFALMALLSATTSGSMAEVLCTIAHASPLNGMATMYLLMSAFHLNPWLKLMRTGERL